MSLGLGLFLAALGVAWINCALHVLFADQPLYSAPASAVRRRPAGSKLVGIGLSLVIFTGGAALWLNGMTEIPGAVLLLALMAAIRVWEVRQWPGDTVIRLGKYAPASACLAGWLVGRVVAGSVGLSDEEARRVGWEAAAGVMAATYVLAAASKLRRTGLAWMAGGHQALLIAERACSGRAIVRSVRRRVAGSTRVCRLIGVFGFASEVLFGLYIFPDLRLGLTVVVLGLHAGIAVLLGYVEPEWWFVMMAITTLTGSGWPQG